MKKIVFCLALFITMTAAVLAQEGKPVVKASADATTMPYEAKESLRAGYDRPYIKGARFNAYFDFGFDIGGYKRYAYTTSGDVYDIHTTLLGLHLFNPTLGVRIFDYGFVGVQIGLADVEMLFSKVLGNHSTQSVDMFTQSYPIMVDLRGFIPINKDIHPYIEYAYGWAPEFVFFEKGNGREHWMFEYNDWFNKMRLGIGFDIKRLSLGLGWNRNYGYGNDGTMFKRDYFYMKIGVKVGRCE